MKTIILGAILVAGYAVNAQNQNHIMRIEFSSLTRGYHELVIITSDSLKFSRTQASQPKVAKAHALKKNDWNDLVKALEKVTLSEIPELKSPTMKRSFDGARHSTITIATDSKQTYIHSFDDENPHEKLKSLMSVIVKKRGKR